MDYYLEVSSEAILVFVFISFHYLSVYVVIMWCRLSYPTAFGKILMYRIVIHGLLIFLHTS